MNNVMTAPNYQFIDGVEYVRADIHDADVARLKARIAALEDAQLAPGPNIEAAVRAYVTHWPRVDGPSSEYANKAVRAIIAAAQETSA